MDFVGLLPIFAIMVLIIFGGAIFDLLMSGVEALGDTLARWPDPSRPHRLKPEEIKYSTAAERALHEFIADVRVWDLEESVEEFEKRMEEIVAANFEETKDLFAPLTVTDRLLPSWKAKVELLANQKRYAEGQELSAKSRLKLIPLAYRERCVGCGAEHGQPHLSLCGDTHDIDCSCWECVRREALPILRERFGITDVERTTMSLASGRSDVFVFRTAGKSTEDIGWKTSAGTTITVSALCVAVSEALARERAHRQVRKGGCEECGFPLSLGRSCKACLYAAGLRVDADAQKKGAKRPTYLHDIDRTGTTINSERERIGFSNHGAPGLSNHEPRDPGIRDKV